MIVFRVRGLADGVDYHQFFLQGSRSWADTTFNHRAHLLEASDGVVLVLTGVAMGVVDLEIQLLDAAPIGVDTDRGWEAVAEVSVRWDDPSVSVAYLATAVGPEFTDFPLPREAGWYRVRAHAKGRDIAFDGVARRPCGERHLLQVWPDEQHRAPLDLRVDDPWARQGRGPARDVPDGAAAAAEDLLRRGYDDLIALLVEAAGAAQRSVAEWSAMVALRRAGLVDAPAVRRLTDLFGSNQPVPSDPLLRGFADTPAGVRSALRALEALSSPDSLAAALNALARAVEVAEFGGLGDALADEAERLLKIWPARWAEHERPISGRR